ncbi:DUF2000 family protein, partial [Mesorhizobium sp. M8A.F.Ca.ET.198.01.1.1]
AGLDKCLHAEIKRGPRGEHEKDRHGQEEIQEHHDLAARGARALRRRRRAGLSTIHRRALERGVTASAYVAELFSTGHDAANRAVFAEFAPDDAKIVDIALRGEKKLVDKITKGARMHG